MRNIMSRLCRCIKICSIHWREIRDWLLTLQWDSSRFLLSPRWWPGSSCWTRPPRTTRWRWLAGGARRRSPCPWSCTCAPTCGSSSRCLQTKLNDGADLIDEKKRKGFVFTGCAGSLLTLASWRQLDCQSYGKETNATAVSMNLYFISFLKFCFCWLCTICLPSNCTNGHIVHPVFSNVCPVFSHVCHWIRLPYKKAT